MTSATERLRALLDERGVAYNTHGERDLTWYDLPSGGRVCVKESVAGFLHVKSSPLTPKQAVEATLGPGTCEVVSSTLHEYEGGYAGSEWEHELSCGDTVWWGSGDAPEWCPWCGRKVVE